MGIETLPDRLVWAPFSTIENPGVNCVTRSPVDSSDPRRLALLVNVSSIATDGTIRHVSALAPGAASAQTTESQMTDSLSEDESLVRLARRDAGKHRQSRRGRRISGFVVR